MNKLTKYKKNKLSKTQKIVISFVLIILTIGVGYSALITNLSISGNITVKEYAPPIAFPSQIKSMIDNNESCFTKYDGQVTDQVNNTVDATNVYFNKCEDKRNIIFGGLCWEMIRTTETGGIKMMYNGEVVDGKCESTRDVHKGLISGSLVGPMPSTDTLFGSSYTYDSTTNTFTLVDTFTDIWGTATYENLLGKYTCMNTSNNCSTITRVIKYSSATYASIIEYKMDDVDYTQIGQSLYNDNTASLSDVGYMYNKEYNEQKVDKPSSGAVFANSFTYDENTNMYTLAGDTYTVSSWSTDYASISNTHYTCLGGAISCSTLTYIFVADSNTVVRGILLTGGKSINDAINDMLYVDDVNTKDSYIKEFIDEWYEKNLISHANALEDTVFCNNRNILDYKGWNPNGGQPENASNVITFENSEERTNLSCQNITDQFSISNNKAKLTYPVALITNEEISNINDSNVLENDARYWTMSPFGMTAGWGVFESSVDGYPYSYGVMGGYTRNSLGVRPMISLKNGTTFSSGDGSETTPWIVQET